MSRTASIVGRARASRAAAMPRDVQPMLATPGSLPEDGDSYTFEYKWDGVRAISYCDGAGGIQIQSRNISDITPNYPELHALSKALGKRRAILDGEIVALDESDRPSFARLQNRMHVKHPTAALLENVPVWYVLFDVIWLQGKWLIDEPHWKRREILEKLKLEGPFWQLTPGHVGEGSAMLDAARGLGMEGLVAKRLDSVYEPGKRSPSWRKIKIVQRQEFVIGGWVSEQGGRSNRVGAILVGYYDAARRLRFAGTVGTGFTDSTHTMLVKRFSKLGDAHNPFAEDIPRKKVRFVSPDLVGEIEYRRWPTGGSLQHAAFKGLREDKPARDVRCERVEGAPVRAFERNKRSNGVSFRVR